MLCNKTHYFSKNLGVQLLREASLGDLTLDPSIWRCWTPVSNYRLKIPIAEPLIIRKYSNAKINKTTNEATM